jgi:hypothetical protein
MKNILSFFLLLILFIPAYSQQGWRDHEAEIRVSIRGNDAIKTLNDLHLNGDIHAEEGFAVLYVVPSELESVKNAGFHTEVMIGDLNGYYKDFWTTRAGQYHDYGQIIALMDSLATTFPDICRKIIFGLTPQARQLTCLEISGNVGMEENEPEVLFDGGIHGDEIGGPENLIRFARYLCTGYGIDPQITGLVNSRKICIYPMVNPDGRANMSRYNSNFVDCNRDWGYMWNGEGSSPASFSQPETRTIRNYIYNHRFVIHITYHSGEEVVLYPWCYRAAHTPDYIPQSQLATLYSTVSGYSSLQTRQSYADYPTNGETIDYSYGAAGTNALTMEISNNKQPPVSQIQLYFQNNVPSMLAMIENAGYGISGTVTDSITGIPVAAAVLVNGLFPVFTDTAVGDYHKYLSPGTFTVKIVANNYRSKILENVQVGAQGTVLDDVRLQPVTGHFAVKVAAVVIPGNNPLDEANTPAATGEPDSIYYSLGKSGWIILDMQDPVLNISGNDFMVYEGDSVAEGYTCQVAQYMDGPWISLGTATGTAAFDLGSAGLSKARFIRITDDGDGLSNAPDAGFDLDAVASLEEPTATVMKEGTSHVLKISPNPAHESIRIDVPGNDLQGTLVISTIWGQDLLSMQMSRSHLQVDIRNLARGFYFVRLSDGTRVLTGKLIKE